MGTERERSNRGRSLLFAFAILASALLGFRIAENHQDAVGYGLQVPAPGLDLSYTYAMNAAAVRGETFGRSFISTYGPFGFLIAAMDLPGIVGPWIFSQAILATFLGLAVSAYVVAAGPGGRRREAGLTLLLLFFIHAQTDEYRWFCLGLLLLLLGVHLASRRGQNAALAGAAALAGLALLVKLSLGLGLLLALAPAAVLAPPSRRFLERAAIGVGAAAVALAGGLLAYQGSLAGAADYVTTAAAVSGGYSAAMSYAEPESWKAGLALLAAVASMAVFAVVSGARAVRLTLLVLALPFFVAWKHSVVRQDVHVLIFVQFGFVALGLLLVAAGDAARRAAAAPFLIVALLALAYPLANPALGDRGRLAGRLLSPARLPGLAGLASLTGFDAHRQVLASESAATLEGMRLPEEALALVGDQGIDVYPWESVFLIPNGFRSAHRPSPASFATYTPALDERNAAFFAGPARPAFVLWHATEGGVRSIDRRHVFWDEPRTLLTLLDRYELAWSGSVFLLRARSEPRFGPREPLGPLTAEWNAWVPLPKGDGVILAEVDQKETLRARFRRVLLRAPAFTMMVRFANGDRSRYRYVPAQGQSGFLVDPLPRNPADVAALFRGECPRTRVEAIRFLGPADGPPPRVVLWRVPLAVPRTAACD
jgi:hypothetical protein